MVTKYTQWSVAAVAVMLFCIVSLPTYAAPSNQMTAQEGGGRPFIPGRVLVQFRHGVSDERARCVVTETANSAAEVGEIPQIRVRILELPPTANQTAVQRALSQRPEVVCAEPDYLYEPAAAPVNDPYYGSQWHLPKISAPGAWNYTTGSNSIIIAILDSGVDSTHPDLAGKLVPGWNFYNNNSDTSDVNGHGTAVAGCAAAVTNNAKGIAAPARDCSIMPVRVSDPGGWAWDSTIAAGLTWAADRGVRVANASYRLWYYPSETLISAAQYFMSKGGVITSAGGNDGSTYLHPDVPCFLSVSATNSSDQLWWNTTKGNAIDLSAPGESIYTTNRGGGYGSWSGTSLSAPITAGIAALMLSVNPSLSGSQVQDILMQSADDLGPAGWDNGYGWGRVNAQRAVSMAAPGGPLPDTTPPAVGFMAPASGATISGSFNVVVAAADDVNVASVNLYIDGTLAAAMLTSPYEFLWDTTAVPDGSHTLQAVAADSSGNSATAQITVTVRNTQDTTAPSIRITSPAEGYTFTRKLTVTVSATDNVGVVKVELYVAGQKITTSTAAPFTTSWTPNSKKTAAGSYTICCKAYDAAGNVGTSQNVTVIYSKR